VTTGTYCEYLLNIGVHQRHVSLFLDSSSSLHHFSSTSLFAASLASFMFPLSFLPHPLSPFQLLPFVLLLSRKVILLSFHCGYFCCCCCYIDFSFGFSLFNKIPLLLNNVVLLLLDSFFLSPLFVYDIVSSSSAYSYCTNVVVSNVLVVYLLLISFWPLLFPFLHRKSF
jgi:hypothetical protein